MFLTGIHIATVCDCRPSPNTKALTRSGPGELVSALATNTAVAATVAEVIEQMFNMCGKNQKLAEQSLHCSYQRI